MEVTAALVSEAPVLLPDEWWYALSAASIPMCASEEPDPRPSCWLGRRVIGVGKFMKCRLVLPPPPLGMLPRNIVAAAFPIDMDGNVHTDAESSPPPAPIVWEDAQVVVIGLLVTIHRGPGICPPDCATVGVICELYPAICVRCCCWDSCSHWRFRRFPAVSASEMFRNACSLPSFLACNCIYNSISYFTLHVSILYTHTHTHIYKI